MSAKVVVPDRIISSAASWVPVRTNAGVTTLASAGKMYCWSQSIRLRSLPSPRNSTIGACPWVLISPGSTIWPVPSMVWRGWKAAAMAAGVSTPTMSAPSIASAPGASTRRVPSTVTTVALVMTRATWRFAAVCAADAGGAPAAPSVSRTAAAATN